MVCSRITEAGVFKYTETYAGELTLELVVVNGSLDTAEVLRQVSGKIRFVLLDDRLPPPPPVERMVRGTPFLEKVQKTVLAWICHTRYQRYVCVRSAEEDVFFYFCAAGECGVGVGVNAQLQCLLGLPVFSFDFSKTRRLYWSTKRIEAEQNEHCVSTKACS